MTNTKPLEPVAGSWDLEVKWAEGVSAERMREVEESFIVEVAQQFNEEACREVPAEIVAITFRKI